MSSQARTYFDFRYTIPGFTFVLAFLILNYDVIYKLASNIDIIKLFVFLPIIISAPAIGFLNAQVWWFVYQIGEEFRFHIEKFRQKELNLVVNEFKLSSAKWGDRLRASAVFDYLTHSVYTDKKEVIEYLRRRYDLYHTLGSTYISMFIAVLLLFFRDYIGTTEKISKYIPLLNSNVFYPIVSNWFMLFVVLIILTILLFVTQLPIRKSWENTAEIILNELFKNKDKIFIDKEKSIILSDMVPNSFKKNDKRQTSPMSSH